MKATFNQSTGNINAEMTPHEAEQFRHGLNLMHQLHDRPDQKAFRDEIIAMSAELIEAIVDSKNTPEFAEQVSRMVSEKRDMLETNRMTTLMFEFAATRCGAYHRLTEMQYTDNRKELPFRVIGIVKTPTENFRAAWNRYGHCFDRLGCRLEEYDLIVRPADDPDNAKAVAESMKLALLVILICILF